MHTAQQSSGNPPAKLFYLLRDGETAGPFTIGQIRAMWQSGSVSADSLFWTESNAEWKSLHEISALLDPTPPYVPPTFPASHNTSRDAELSNRGISMRGTEPTNFELLQVQAKMKSKSTAALLAIFFPFVGGAYASAWALLTIPIYLLFFGLNEDMIGNSWPLWLFGFYLMSVFNAVRKVEEFNTKLIDKAAGVVPQKKKVWNPEISSWIAYPVILIIVGAMAAALIMVMQGNQNSERMLREAAKPMNSGSSQNNP